MFSSKKANSLISSVYKRSIRTVENDFSLSLEEILVHTNRSNCHQRNLELLLLEIYKSINCLNPELMWELFPKTNPKYGLRSGQNVEIPKTSTRFGMKSFVFRGALAWNHLPKALKDIPSLLDFKNVLKGTKIHCHCKICS